MSRIYAVDREVHNTFLVRQRDRRRRRELWWILVVVLPLVALLLAQIHLQAQIRQVGYDVTELQRELDEVQQQERALHQQAAALSTPRRVERLATELLGMRPPTPEQLVTMPADRYGRAEPASMGATP